jgi:outer membrane protein TolC
MIRDQRKLILIVFVLICLSISWPAYSQSLSLSDCINKALSQNPSISVAQEQVSQADAAYQQARAGRRIQLSFISSPSVSTGNVYQPPPSSETFAAIQNTLQLPIPVGQKANLIELQASKQFSAATYQLESSKRAVCQCAAITYQRTKPL